MPPPEVTVGLAGTALVGGAVLAAYMAFAPGRADEAFPAKLDAAFRSSATARKVREGGTPGARSTRAVTPEHLP